MPNTKQEVAISIVAHRDPFWSNPMDGRRTPEVTDEVRARIEAALSGLSQRARTCATSEALDELLRTAIDKYPLQRGPVLSSVDALNQQLSALDRTISSVRLVYTHDLARRYDMTKTALLSPAIGIPNINPVVLPTSLNPADLIQCYSHIKSAIHHHFDELLKDSHVHLLLGAGTPQLRFALILWAHGASRSIQVWGYKAPYELAPDEPALSEIKFDGGDLSLPRLSVGDPDDQIAMLEAEVERLRSALASIDVRKPDTVIKTGKEDRIWEGYRRVLAEGDKATQPKIARLLEVTQGRLSQMLKEAGLRLKRGKLEKIDPDEADK